MGHLTISLALRLEGQQLRYAGNGIGYEDVIIKGNPDELKVSSHLILFGHNSKWLNSLLRTTPKAKKLLLLQGTHRAKCQSKANWSSFILSMQADPIVSKSSELLRLGLMPSASEIKAGKVRSHILVLTETDDSIGSAYGGYVHIGGQSQKGIRFVRSYLNVNNCIATINTTVTLRYQVKSV